MSDTCNCGSDCVCKKVTVGSRRIIEQVLLVAKAQTVLECLNNLEQFCEKGGYILNHKAMHYGFENYNGKVIMKMSVIARKYGKLEVTNADL